MKKFSSRSLVAAAAAVALLALSGCSDDVTPDPTPAKEPTASGTNTPVGGETEDDGEEPTNTPAPTITPDANGQYEWCDPAEQKPFTGEAAEKFGAEKVMDAYCTMVQMQMDYSFDSNLWRKTDGFTAQEFSPVRESLTQTARKDWDAQVAKVVAGTAPGDTNGINGLMTADFIGGSAYTLAQPAVFNRRFSAAQSWVDNANPSLPRLGLKFSVGADVALVRTSDDKAMAYPWDKTVTYWLTPGRKGGERQWYIDGFAFEVADQEPVKREALIKGEEPPQ